MMPAFKLNVKKPNANYPCGPSQMNLTRTTAGIASDLDASLSKERRAERRAGPFARVREFTGDRSVK